MPRAARIVNVAESVVPLPMRMRVRTYLPTLGGFLATSELKWPPRAKAPVVVAEREEAPSASAPGDAPDLVMAEVNDLAQFVSLVEAAHRDLVTTLLFVPPDLLGSELPPGLVLTSRVALVPVGDDVAAVVREAARQTERLVHRRVARLLLEHWGRVRFDAGTHLARALVAAPRPKPSGVAVSLHAVEHAHICGVAGLWWKVPSKQPPLDLRVAHGTVDAHRALVPRAVASALEPEGRDWTLLEVDERTGGCSSARRRVEAGPGPDLVWLGAVAGGDEELVEFARWLHARGWPPLVATCTAVRSAAAVRELLAMGVLMVSGAPTPALRETMRVADARLFVEQAAELEEALQQELQAVSFPGVGDRSIALERLVADVVAFQRHSGETAVDLARRLGVDAKLFARFS